MDFKNIDINKLLDSFPPEKIREVNNAILKKQEEEYNLFLKNLDQGICYLCNNKIDEFDKDNFCFHWFTYPKGIKKKYFKAPLSKPMGFYNLDAYLRWLANTDRFIGNINDLNVDKSEKSFIETTIKYKSLEWSFSIGYSDLKGHEKSSNANYPHYHIQMTVNGNIFIKFNDFHIPFTEEDLFRFQLKKQAGDRIIIEQPNGIGMSFLENDKNIDIIEKSIEATDDFDNATLRYQTFLLPNSGEKISGNTLQEAMKISEQTKEPIGQVLRRLVKNADIKTIISRGKGVPEQKKRSGKK